MAAPIRQLIHPIDGNLQELRDKIIYLPHTMDGDLLVVEVPTRQDAKNVMEDLQMWGIKSEASLRRITVFQVVFRVFLEPEGDLSDADIAMTMQETVKQCVKLERLELWCYHRGVLKCVPVQNKTDKMKELLNRNKEENHIRETIPPIGI